jgi:hypothetical protein
MSRLPKVGVNIEKIDKINFPEFADTFYLLKSKILSNNIKEDYVSNVPYDTLTTTDFNCFFSTRIEKKSLNSSYDFPWNQSNARRYIQLTENYVVIIIKFNTRPRTQIIVSDTTELKNPGYKLWVCNVHEISTNQYNQVGNFVVSFVWCEKGQQGSIKQNPQIRKNEENNIDSAQLTPSNWIFSDIDNFIQGDNLTNTINKIDSLRELSFLRTFMNQNVAKEIFGNL